jgi:hypothetical protein
MKIETIKVRREDGVEVEVDFDAQTTCDGSIGRVITTYEPDADVSGICDGSVLTMPDGTVVKLGSHECTENDDGTVTAWAEAYIANNVECESQQ